MENQKFSLYTTLNTEKLLESLNSSLSGLTEEQASQRYHESGPNKLKHHDSSTLSIFIHQLTNPFVYLLLIIAGIYWYTKESTETIIILIIVFVNSAIGFYQEYHSNMAMKLLASYLKSTHSVKRSNSIVQVDSELLVPGDILVLNPGDIIPADCRFIESDNLVIDESTLTGESVPVKKISTPLTHTASTFYDAHNIGFTGTVIASGTALGVIFATGINTALGNIATLTQQESNKSKIAQGTTQLARMMIVLTILSIGIIFFIKIVLLHQNISYLNFVFFSAALAITVIPTALPIVITFCMTKGALALQKHKIIVKRLSSIEDLGTVTVLCTDKTGTLTENALRVNSIYHDDKQTLFFAALSSALIMNKKENIPKGFDAALAEKITPELLNNLKTYEIIKELPFSYEKYRSISLIKKNNEYTVIAKGVLEHIIDQCPFLTKKEKSDINEWAQENESTSNRIWAIATKKMNTPLDLTNDKEDHHITYDTLGLISFSDPLNTTATKALQKAESLGVQIKIISGDSAEICYSIAKQLGFEDDPKNIVLGTIFEKSNKKQKIILVRDHTIFARITPEQKYEIINLLKETAYVAYMGDGINDAPALKSANVGIAVNHATPVAREAAEIILLKKNLLDVVLGIEEGRKITINTLKYILITLSCNFGLFFSLSLASLIITYLPMLPLQLLFLDLITDTPLIAISTDKVSTIELKKPPLYSFKKIFLFPLLFGTIITFFNSILILIFKAHPTQLQTYWFITSALTQLLLIFSLRTILPLWKASKPSWALLILSGLIAILAVRLPYTLIGHNIFLFTSPHASDMAVIILLLLCMLSTVELIKHIFYRFYSPFKN